MLLFPFVVLFASFGDWFGQSPVGFPKLRLFRLSAPPPGVIIGARDRYVQSL
jgi:hypothetical protein